MTTVPPTTTTDDPADGHLALVDSDDIETRSHGHGAREGVVVDWAEHAALILAAALVYASRGWRVILLHGIAEDHSCTCGRERCRDNPQGRGKHPRLWDAHAGATTDPEVIRRWLDQYPDSNIGVVLGPSGLLVVDGDHALVVGILEAEMVTSTWTQWTTRGRHWVFATELWGEKEIKMDGVPCDILSGNNLVVMHPSRQGDGSRRRCDDIHAAVLPAPQFAQDLVLRNGEVPLDRRGKPTRRSRTRPRSAWYQAMLNDEHDLELDDSVRHADTKTYRKRHAAIRSVLLHEDQREVSEVSMVTTIMTSTLRTKARESGDPEGWVREEIRKAREWIKDNPADCPLSGESVAAANRDDAGLTSTQRKVLRGLQTEAARQGEGRFTVSYADLAITSKVSVGTAFNQVGWLTRHGWLDVRFRALRGNRQATVYSLRLPARLRQEPQGVDDSDLPQGGDDVNTTLHIEVGVVGGVQPITPLATEVLTDSDAYWWGRGLLGGSVLVLQALSTEEPQTGKGLARRLGKTPATIRHHLNKLDDHDLVIKTADGTLLHPDWLDRLDTMAAAAGVLGRADLRRKALDEKRRLRKEVRKDYAQQHNLPLRSATPEASRPRTTQGITLIEGWPEIDPTLLALDAEHAMTDEADRLAAALAFDVWANDFAEQVIAGLVPCDPDYDEEVISVSMETVEDSYSPSATSA